MVRTRVIVPAPNVARSRGVGRSDRVAGLFARDQPSTVESTVSEPQAAVCKAPRVPKCPCRHRQAAPVVQVPLGGQTASDASTLVWNRRSPGRSEAKHAHGADREASQSRTVESARVKSACGRRAMTSHLNA